MSSNQITVLKYAAKKWKRAFKANFHLDDNEDKITAPEPFNH